MDTTSSCPSARSLKPSFRGIAATAASLLTPFDQVVPHEVVGMANYTKNMLIGTGGKANIDLTHFIGAVRRAARQLAAAIQRGTA